MEWATIMMILTIIIIREIILIYIIIDKNEMNQEGEEVARSGYD